MTLSKECRRYLFLMVVLFVCAACRTADGPGFDPLLSYDGQDALVFIYRPTPSYAQGGGLAPDIIIDGQKIIDLKSMGYTRVFLKQGMHSLRVVRAHAYKNMRESEYGFVIPSDKKRCFIRVALPNTIDRDLEILTINTAFSLATKIYIPIVHGPHKEGSGFVMDFVDDTYALKEIKSCKYISPKLDSL